MVLGGIYFSYCNSIRCSDLHKHNPFLMFSKLIASGICMEVVSRGYLFAYKNTSCYSFCCHCLSSSCSHCMENAGRIMLPRPSFSPLPGSLLSTSTPKSSLACVPPPCPRADPKSIPHGYAYVYTCIGTDVLFSHGLGAQHGFILGQHVYYQPC